jgi:2TM domain
MMADESERARAREIAMARYGFRWHLPIYLIVNAGLILIWFYAGGGFFWPVFPLAFWGLGVLGHYIGAYRTRLGEAWIARETEKVLRERAGKP